MWTVGIILFGSTGVHKYRLNRPGIYPYNLNFGLLRLASTIVTTTNNTQQDF
jgi:hypothetical protein